MGGTVFMALGFGRGRGTERREIETRGYEPFALHAPIHQAILEVGDQEEGRSSRLGTVFYVPYSLNSSIALAVEYSLRRPSRAMCHLTNMWR